MKNLLAALLACIAMQSIGQTLLFDNFSDSNFTANPTWEGDTSDFIINSDLRLQLLGNSEGGSSALATRYNAYENQQITVSFALDFSPSKSNNTKVYLYADNFNVLEISNAVYIQVGENGAEDNLELWEVVNGASSKIAEGIPARFASGGSFTVSVLINNNQFVVQSKVDAESSFTDEFSAQINTISGDGYFIFNPSYSSTRKDKFFLDSVKIDRLPDLIPPRLTKFEVLDSVTINLSFSEKLDSSTVLLENFEMDNYQIVELKNRESGVGIVFSPGLQTGNYSLSISNLKDLEGNVISDTSVQFYFYREFEPKFGDVMINEFMSDPTPSFGLPEVEYIEILNTVDEDIPLDKWNLVVNDYPIPLTGIEIQQGEPLALFYERDSLELEGLSNIAFLKEWKSLLNAGASIKLLGPKGRVIDSVTYSTNFFPADYTGGKSLCRIPNSNNCESQFQWEVSLDEIGGSPGRINLIPETDLLVEHFEVIGQDSIIVKFTQQPDFQKGFIEINSQRVEFYATLFDAKSPTYLFTFESELPQGIFFDFRLSEFYSCLGKPLEFEKERLLIPVSAKIKDVVLNEILFNPRPKGVDFIEFYNTSNNYLSVNNLKLVVNDDTLSLPSDITMQPEQFLVLTTNRQVLEDHYFVSNPDLIYELKSLKNMPDDSGSVKLLFEDESVIDGITYYEEMHFSGLYDPEGVSLERIELKPFGEWFSAAENEGGATPGRANSQFVTDGNILGEKKIWLNDEYFSPNNDGFNDVLEVGFNLGTIGNKMEINVMTFSGHLVKNLASNALQTAEGKYYWDGSTENGEPLSSGVYLISAVVYSENGKKENFRIPVLVDYP